MKFLTPPAAAGPGEELDRFGADIDGVGFAEVGGHPLGASAVVACAEPTDIDWSGLTSLKHIAGGNIPATATSIKVTYTDISGGEDDWNLTAAPEGFTLIDALANCVCGDNNFYVYGSSATALAIDVGGVQAAVLGIYNNSVAPTISGLDSAHVLTVTLTGNQFTAEQVAYYLAQLAGNAWFLENGLSVDISTNNPPAAWTVDVYHEEFPASGTWAYASYVGPYYSWATTGYVLKSNQDANYIIIDDLENDVWTGPLLSSGSPEGEYIGIGLPTLAVTATPGSAYWAVLTLIAAGIDPVVMDALP